MKKTYIVLAALSAVAFGALVVAGMDPVTAFVLANAPAAIDLKQVTDALEEQGKAWKEFQKQNNDLITALKTDTVDKPLLKATVDTINTRLGELGETLAKFQAAQQRLALAGTGGGTRIKGEHEVSHEKAFGNYLRKGDKRALETLHQEHALGYAFGTKLASVGSDADGGFFVTPDLSGRLIQKIFETSPIRSEANVVTISTDALEGPLDNDDSVTTGWVGEQTTRPATATPKLAKWRIPVFEMYAMPETTQQVLDDAAVDVEAWLAGKLQDKMIRTENTAFVTGDGVTKPRGFLTYPTAATSDGSRAWGTLEHVATGTSGGFGANPNGSDKLITLLHQMKSAYRAGAKWYMARATLGQARTLKDTNGSYIWLPQMTAGQNSQLLGYPVVEWEDMSALGANSLSVMFANMNLGYQIVDRQGFRVLRDPFTNKPFVRFYTTRRVGGDVLHFEAIKFLKFI